MRTAPLAAALLIAAAAPCGAFLLWRDHVPCRWSDAPLAADGAEAKWIGADQAVAPQVDVSALDDGRHLELRLSADGDYGRALLSGAFRQDIRLWFLRPDRTLDWGILIPFGSLGAPTSAPRPGDVPAMPDVQPLSLAGPATAVSTAALPADVSIHWSMARRDPEWEILVPLERLHLKKGRTLLFDLASSAASPEIVQRFAEKPEPVESAEKEPPSFFGGRMRRAGRRVRHASPGGGIPPPIHVRLAVRLPKKV